MPRHIIHKQTIHLEIDRTAILPASYIQELQEQLVAQWRGALGDKLEKMLDELAPEGTLVRIESLHLNLGVLEEKELETQFEEKLLGRLKDAILLADNGRTAKGRTTPGDTRNGSLLDAFTFFLVAGRMPWYQQVNSWEKWEDNLMTTFSEADWLRWLKWFRQSPDAKMNMILQRLVFQFSHPFLDSLLAGVDKNWTSHWTGVQQDLWALLVEINGVPSTVAGKAIYWSALTTILQEGAREPSLADQTRSILENTLRQLTHEGHLPNFREGSPRWRRGLHSQWIREALNTWKGKGKKDSQGGVENPIHEDLSGPPDSNGVSGHSDEPGDDINRLAGKQEAIPVSQSGLILLHPFLSTLFTGLGYLEEGRFLTEKWERAVLLLHYLATGLTNVQEFELALPKVLCGMPLDKPVPRQLELTDPEQEEGERLLRAITGHWPPLKNTSVKGLQESFLQREGQLRRKEAGWMLHVETRTIDILLDKLPWGYSIIKLPWMPTFLTVSWRPS